jgi:N-acetylglucosaminyl-diphospho-decaprenol L-rhamnosyltransferase
VHESVGLVLSVVSHGQRELLNGLLEDLALHVKTPFRLIVTENIPEEPDLPVAGFPFRVDVIRNTRRKGFGENHNAALKQAGSGLFCVMNPDIRLREDPFPPLMALLKIETTGVVSPMVTDPELRTEDHARDFPSIFTLIAKAFGARPSHMPNVAQPIIHPDWIAGMFMLFRSETLRAVHGFDERYFLYYEDVDLCARLRDAGYQVAVCSEVKVIHAARRKSRRNLRFASWHLRSALRFFLARPRIALGLSSRRLER